jgi:polysaccharide export outer membrane protein
VPWEFDPTFEYQSDYRIRVGDEILVEFLSDPEPATNASRVIVRPDGRISVRGVDDVLAAGRTPAGLDSVLTAGFGRILVDPSLSVIITRFAGERVFVLGEVTSPREIPLTGPLTALQAIATAGGFTIKAQRNEVVLVRPMGGGRVAAVRVNLEKLISEPERGQDLALRGQDVLIVPKSGIGKIGDVIELYFKNINPALITVLTLSEIYKNELFFAP